MCSRSSGDRRWRRCSSLRSGGRVQADDPLLLRMLRGEKVDRPPVWMMRQAGRYMKVYQDLCKKHKTFRERSENVDLAVQNRLSPPSSPVTLRGTQVRSPSTIDCCSSMRLP